MNFTDILTTLGLSLLPVSEIRGAIINAVSILKLDGFELWFTYCISVLGNFLPVPFIILLFRPLLKFFKKFRLFRGICLWLEKRTHKKAGEISKKGPIALFLFVAIPLPTTGAWTGAMIAGLFDMRFRRALLPILLGIITAGLIMVILCKMGEEALGFLSFLIR